MFIFSSLRSMDESKKISDKHRISKLWVLVKASIKGTLVKSWAARPFKFQWQNLIGEDFLGHEFISISPEFTKSIFEKIVAKKQKEDMYRQQNMVWLISGSQRNSLGKYEAVIQRNNIVVKVMKSEIMLK